MAMWSISLLTNISNTIPQNKRGRYLASLGGINRIGWFIGPIIGGLLGAHIGLKSVFIAQAIILVPLLLFITVYFSKSKQGETSSHKTIKNDAILNAIQTNFPQLLQGGTAIIPLQVIRSSREILIPLWATVIGLSVDQIGFVIAGAALIDMSMFLPIGYIMDTKGRKWTSIPSCIVLAIGVCLLPFSNTLLTFTIITILIGFGNGLGSGAMITLGSDLAPPNQRSSFFGAWKLLGDIGGLSGPIIVGQVANALTLGIASYSISIIGLIAAAALHFVVPETLKTASKNNENDQQST
jgi:MFS family permease